MIKKYGFIILAALSIFIVLIFLFFAEDWTKPASIASAATVVIATLTMALALETYFLRYDQTEQLAEMRRQSVKPSVDIYIMPERNSRDNYCVRLANNGLGIAKNIKINILPYTNPDSKGSDGESSFNSFMKEQYESIPFIDKGVQTLGIRSTREAYLDTNKIEEKWVVYGDKKGSPTNWRGFSSYTTEVEIEFEDINGWRYKTFGVIDLSDGIKEDKP